MSSHVVCRMRLMWLATDINMLHVSLGTWHRTTDIPGAVSLQLRSCAVRTQDGEHLVLQVGDSVRIRNRAHGMSAPTTRLSELPVAIIAALEQGLQGQCLVTNMVRRALHSQASHDQGACAASGARAATRHAGCHSDTLGCCHIVTFSEHAMCDKEMDMCRAGGYTSTATTSEYSKAMWSSRSWWHGIAWASQQGRLSCTL
jgi:hypothetical protein